MAAFSHQHSSLLLDSFVEPSTSNNLSSLLLEQDTTHPTYFSPICSSYCLQEIPVHASFHETSSLGCTIHPNNNKVPFTCTTHPCLNEEQGKDLSSTMVVEPKTGDQLVTKVVTPMVKKRSENKIVSKVAREGKGKKRKISDAMLKNREEKKVKSDKRAKKKVVEEVPTGYFHVRARRGQATDSHSLAERIRREKIGERMKLLQSLVPGCGKVTGKTQILDEIINYVQFLQNQVEFLVAKLASVSPMLSEFEFDLETYTFESEKLCTLEPHHLPSALQSSSTQLSPLAEPTPDSTSFLTQQDLKFNFTSLDIGIPPCYMNDERLIKFVNQYGFNYLCPNFQ